MKKLLATVAILMMIAGNGFASGVIGPSNQLPDGTLKPDNPAWTGTKYNGNPAIFSNTLIGSNINYIKTITIQQGLINVKLPGQTAISLQMGAFVRIDLSDLNNIGYKNALANYQAWARVKPSILDGSPCTFEDSGILPDNAYFDSVAFNPGVVSPTGSRPWFIQQSITMDYNTYQTQFKPALDAWLASTNIMGAPTTVAITDHGLNGTLIQWNHK